MRDDDNGVYEGGLGGREEKGGEEECDEWKKETPTA